jgi:hypothetical protein
MTMRIDGVEDLEQLLLQEMKDDYVGLWEIAQLVRTELGYEHEAGIYETTLQVIRDMLMQELIRPGVPTEDGGFKPWPTDPENALVTISQKWAQLGRPLTVGDIAWFDLTEGADRVASTR